MKTYLNMLQKIIDENTNPKTGELNWQMNDRTGENTIRLVGQMFEHDMSTGFPLLTTKQMAVNSIFTELEFFLKGYTDKKWLQDRKCKIWNEWGNPERVAKSIQAYEAANGPASQAIKNQIAQDEMDLGPIYGFQWRHFGAKYPAQGRINDKTDQSKIGGVDQVANVINTLHRDPSNRRARVGAWHPGAFSKMALPPCHTEHQVLISKDTKTNENMLHLIWNQRSCDMFLGIPFNIASYAMLLLLYAKELNCKPGKLVGMLADTHIYQNQIDQVRKQLTRTPHQLPTMEIPNENWNSMLNWSATQRSLQNYICHDKLQASVVR